MPARIRQIRSVENRQPAAGSPDRLPRVVLLVETSSLYGRRILEGIGRYVREHGPWSLFFEQRGPEDPPPRWLENWQGDGIISRTATRAMAETVRACGVPVVELLGDRRDGRAKVCCDERATGRMAAEHLLACGLRNFGHFAYGENWWIDMYREGLQQTVEARGLKCHVYRPPHANRGLFPQWRDSELPRVMAWLDGLPKPVGVCSPAVVYAARVLDICRTMALAVPDQVAVLAAPDDEALCNVTSPPLSAVDLGTERIGYEAAALLARMMAGQPAPRHTQWIPPSRVVVRQSTDVLAVPVSDVADAIRFIRAHACQGAGVRELLAALGMSRPTLERKFRQFLGHSVRQEILRVRIERARSLLTQSDLSVDAVARQSGFDSSKNLARVFRRQAGTTPQALRRGI